MKLCFNEGLLDILTPEEIVYASLCIEEGVDDEMYDVGGFYESSAYDVLFDHYADEMPYGVAKARTGDPACWILWKLKKISDADV